MSRDVPTPQVRNGLSVRCLGGVLSTLHVIRCIHVTTCSNRGAGNSFHADKGGGWEEKLRAQTAHVSWSGPR